IETFDDKLKSLRLFHPESQRKISDVNELLIGPAREFTLPSKEKHTPLLRHIKAILREQKRSLGDREALYSRFVNQSFFQEIDYWGPIILEQQGLFSPVNSL